jgi:hypothetical protein
MSYLDPRGVAADAEATIARERFFPGTDVRNAKSPSAAALDEARGSPMEDRRDAEEAFAERALQARAYIEGAVRVIVACAQRATVEVTTRDIFRESSQWLRIVRGKALRICKLFRNSHWNDGARADGQT